MIALVILANKAIDKKVQKIADLNKEMRELRDVFIATRSDLMKIKMESSIISKMQEKGLYVAENPPQKIIVKQ